MIITLTGLPGSGKTTVVKHLSESLGVPWYSVGNLRGKMAKERGMTIDELNKLGESEAFTDKDVDDYQLTLGQSGKSFVIDGRLSWHFIPSSFKVFLDVDPEIGAKRIYQASQKGERGDEISYTSEDEVQDFIKKRVQSDVMRYQKYYQIDFLNKENYDLIIDTSHLSPEETVRQILEKIPQS